MPRPDFDHLFAMSDVRATFEHARFAAPRPEHGYCTDDMARVLVVTAREPNPSQQVSRLSALSLRFLTEAQGSDGGSRNRMGADGRWTDAPTFDDCWGRSLWGFGTAAARAQEDDVRRSATFRFERGAAGRSPWLRAMAFAGLGAAEIVAVDPGNAAARSLLADAADRIATTGHGTSPWPEARLAYANAAIPEVLIAAGSLLDRPDVLGNGLEMLRWLLDHETHGGHLSVTPAGGGVLGDAGPAFDQQPIEVAAIADACARAASVDGDPRWPGGIAAAVAWFLGDNDGGHLMWDPSTGGGLDGLQDDGANQNQGTESTLALLSTLQHVRRPVLASP